MTALWAALLVLALVGLVQSLAWIGGARASGGRRLLGVFLAPLALVVFVLALVSLRVPGVWG